MTLIRRLFLVLMLATAPLAGASSALAGDLPPVTTNDRILGHTDAPVTVVEYASFVCPHCAAWHKEVFPAFKAAYIDTGKVRLVYRTLPTSPENLAMTAAGIARCAAPNKFFDVVDSLFDGQSALTTGGQHAWFTNAIAAGGRTEDQIKTCFADPATSAELNAEIQGAGDAGVDGTPTFFVNGQKIANPSLASLGAAIDAARSGT
jgi:protein-disulfide isomerase